MSMKDIEFYLSIISEEFMQLNKNLKSLESKLDNVLELNAEKLIRSLWNTLEKIIEEHP